MTNDKKNKTAVDALKLAIQNLTGGKASLEVGTSGNAMCLRIIVHRGEYGKVCGSKGKMIRAIKYLWEVCMSRKQGLPIRVTLEEPTYGFAEGRSAEVPSENFNAEEYCELIKSIMSLICDAKIIFVEVEPKSWQSKSSHIYQISGEETDPRIASEEFFESCTVLFTAMAKASGGQTFYKFSFGGHQWIS